MELPSHYRIRRALIRLLGLRSIPKAGSLRSRLREKLFTVGWPSNEGYPAQGGQDRYLDDFLLHGEREGFFVEIGANDGETFSNCLFFERERGWSGLCLEPNPVAFDKLKASRPEAENLNLAVGAICGEIDFPIFSDAEESLYASRDKASEEGTRKIRQIDLPTLFREYGVEKIDLLSIDIEGGEEDVLATLSETEMRPRFLAVEENTTPEELDLLMRDLGYDLSARVWPDRIYRHRSI